MGSSFSTPAAPPACRKGAVISHRAMIARALVFASELNIAYRDAFVAWAPLFHMASTDHSVGNLAARRHRCHHRRLSDRAAVVRAAAPPDWLVCFDPRHDRGVHCWLPGANDQPSRASGCCGAMADLVPPHVLAEVTELLQAPYVNSFGSTETGLPPATRSLIPIGVIPEPPSRSSKTPSARSNLVDPADNEVRRECPGELAIRGTDAVLRATGKRKRPTHVIFAAAGFTWAMCSDATTTAR